MWNKLLLLLSVAMMAFDTVTCAHTLRHHISLKNADMVSLAVEQSGLQSKYTKNPNVPTYVFIPKTGTTSVVKFMNSCASGFISEHQMEHVGGNKRMLAHSHIKAKQDNIVVVLRDPVKRFVSLLSYRQREENPRGDWGKLPFKKPNSVVIDAMSDKHMRSFQPYGTQESYVRNQKSVRFLCSPREMHDFLINEMHFSGCDPFPHSNPTKHRFGEIRKDQEARIRNVYHEDVQLWNTHCAHIGA